MAQMWAHTYPSIPLEQRRFQVVDRSMQRWRYGGFHFSAALYGWLVSIGIGSILSSLLTALGGTVVLTTGGLTSVEISHHLGIMTIASSVLTLLTLAAAYFAGGYVGGRMVRFDGRRQGLGVWAIGVVTTVLLGITGAIFGAKYNVLQQLHLPYLPIHLGGLTIGGLLFLLVSMIVTFIASILGGVAGEHYHQRIDRTTVVRDET